LVTGPFGQRVFSYQSEQRGEDPEVSTGSGKNMPAISEQVFSRRDFLKLSASGIVLISVTAPGATFAYQSNSPYAESGGFGREGRQAEWRQASLVRASQLRMTQTDLGVRTHLAESIGALMSRVGKEFLEHAERKMDEINKDALIGAWYVLSKAPFSPLPPLPGNKGFVEAYKTVSLVVGMVEHVEVMSGGHMSEDYAIQTLSDAIVDQSPMIEAAAKKAAKSHQNAFEESRNQRDLRNINREIEKQFSEKSARDIDAEQYRRGPSDRWSNSRTA
jgi:hypothetical protein